MRLFGTDGTVRDGSRRETASPRGLGRSLTGKRLRHRRVPVVLQMSELECGAACLAMILRYHGRETRLEEVRERCGVSRDGLDALTVVEGARTYGLRVKAYTLEPAALEHLRLPAIVHWNFNHFVVVERWSPQGASIVDPASGRRWVGAAEFDSAFTGVVMTFEPSLGFERRRTTGRAVWWPYLRYALRTPGITSVLSQVLAASLLLTVLGLAVPLFTKVLVDQVLPMGTASLMSVLGIGVLVVALALLTTNYLRAALLVYLQARLDSQLMLGFFEHVLSLPFKFFQQRSSGDLIMRLGSNAQIRETLTNQTLSVVLDGGLIVAYAVILLTQAPLFGATALVIGALQVAVVLGTTRKMHSLMEQGLSAQAASEGYLVEALTGVATLKASGAEDRAMEHWSDLFFKQLNTSLRREQLSAATGAVLATLGTVSPLVLLWVGAFSVLEGRMSLGTMLALSALATSFLTPLASLVAAGQQLQLVGAYLARILDVVEAEPEQELEQVQSAPPLTGRVELRNVSFRYDPNSPWILRDVSAAIEPGQKVALVGRTGSGKSTLAKLLLGLYTPTEGSLSFDGLPLAGLNYRTLRRQVGIVMQESTLFNGSIRENIAFNDADLPFGAVVEAAQRAVIHNEIERMPMGYETLVAEDGSALSGGQRQRVSLARALAHNPALLVLDEATSHLDVNTERQVNRNVSDLACTQIVIAHRLSTVRDADVILVLDAGEIVERGSHEELLALDGYYAALVRGQLQSEASEEATQIALLHPSPTSDGSSVGLGATLPEAGRGGYVDQRGVGGGETNVEGAHHSRVEGRGVPQ